MSKRICNFSCDGAELPDWPESPNVDSAVDIHCWMDSLTKSLSYELKVVAELLWDMEQFFDRGGDAEDRGYRKHLLGTQYETLKAKKYNILVALLDVNTVFL